MTCPIPFPSVIDATMRSAFFECPRKFFYSYMKGLRKGKSIHLHFGGCLAKGVEEVRKAYYGQVGTSTKSAIARGAQAIILAWGNWEIQNPKEKKTLEAALDALWSYFEEWPLDTDKFRPLELPTGPAVECSFAYPISVLHPTNGELLVYAGRFDMLAKNGDSIFVVDEKTTSYLGASWASQFNLRGQLSGYAKGAQVYGFPISGIVIRGVGIMQNDIKFVQEIVQRPDWQIAAWEKQLERDVKRMIACWREDYWDQSLDAACTSFGECSFMPLCTSPNPERWEGDYLVEHWNPLTRKEDVNV